MKRTTHNASNATDDAMGSALAPMHRHLARATDIESGIWSDAWITDLPASERRDLEASRIRVRDLARMGSLAPMIKPAREF